MRNRKCVDHTESTPFIPPLLHTFSGLIESIFFFPELTEPQEKVRKPFNIKSAFG